MNSYLYGKWRNSPGDGPVEFYSELDPARWELRKVEMLADGRMGLASANRSTHGTQLAIISIPPMSEIMAQTEFESKLIRADEFEAVWKRAGG